MPNHYSTLIKLGTPIVVGQIGNLVLNFADTLMIGHHSTTELAAASFVNGIFVLLKQSDFQKIQPLHCLIPIH